MALTQAAALVPLPTPTSCSLASGIPHNPAPVLPSRVSSGASTSEPLWSSRARRPTQQGTYLSEQHKCSGTRIVCVTVHGETRSDGRRQRRSCAEWKGPPWHLVSRRSAVRGAAHESRRARHASPIQPLPSSSKPGPEKAGPTKQSSNVPHAFLPRALFAVEVEDGLAFQVKEGLSKYRDLGSRDDRELELRERARDALESWLRTQDGEGLTRVKDEEAESQMSRVRLAFEEWLEARDSGSELKEGEQRVGKGDAEQSLNGEVAGESTGKATGWWGAILAPLGGLSPRFKGLALLNVLTFLYGSNIPVVKGVGTVLNPAAFSAGRFGIAALAFSPFLSEALRDKRTRDAGFELGTLASMGYLLQALGLMTTEAGRASFMSTFTVIVVPLLAGLFGAKIPWLTWASAAAALAGVFLLESSGAPPCVGDIWTFASAVIFGVHMLRSEFHVKSMEKGKAISLISLQLAVIAGSSLLWTAYSHATSGQAGLLGSALAGDWGGLEAGLVAIPWLPMLYTGLLSTALCLWIEIVSLRDVTATEAALVYTLEPLWGAGFAWTLLGERWGSTGWLGAVLILGGSMATQIFGQTESHVKAAEVAEAREDNRGSDSADSDRFARALAQFALSEVEEQKVLGSFEEFNQESVGLKRRTKQ